jgi:hypothetical protein
MSYNYPTLANRQELEKALPHPPIEMPARLSREAMAIIKENINLCEELVRDVLEDGADYGTAPGIKDPFLWDPGASKIINSFNAYPEARLVSRQTEKVIGSGVGAASTWETKYKYRWVKNPEEWGYAKGSTKYDKDRKRYRIPNPEHGELVNTIMNMAAKRSEVDAAKSLPGAGTALRKLFGLPRGEGAQGGEDWTWFWGQVRQLGLDSTQVHELLNVGSLKDWTTSGKTLKQAVDHLSRIDRTAEVEEEEPPTHADEEQQPSQREAMMNTIKEFWERKGWGESTCETWLLKVTGYKTLNECPDEALEKAQKKLQLL